MQGIVDCGALVAPRHVSTVDNRAQHTPKKIRPATLGGESAGFSLLLALVFILSALLALQLHNLGQLAVAAALTVCGLPLMWPALG